MTVVTSRTRSVHAASAPSSVSESGLSKAMRSPQHSELNGPSSTTRAHSFSTAASRSGSITGSVIPICTTGFWHADVPDVSRPTPGSMRHMAIRANAIAHVRLTVTDIARSRQFYESVFGWPVALEMPADADDATRDQFGFLFGGVIYGIGDVHDRTATGRDRPFRRGPRWPGPPVPQRGKQGRNWTPRQHISTIYTDHP